MNLVITMSRRFGTGASIIAKELSERLHIPVYDKDDVEHGMRENAFESEADAIRELEFLKNKSNVINIYVCADKEDRINRIMKLFSLTREAAEVMLEETDKQRAEYYYKNTGKTWGDVNNYHMILNTSDLGIENCADILMRYFEMKDYI